MNVRLVPPFAPKNDTLITIGGSKSESNRLLILQALYPNLQIENLSQSDDTVALQKGLLGGTEVNIGPAGTAMRFLTAYFSVLPQHEVVLTGSARMLERPIGILVEALKSLGAKIEYLGQEGYPPLRIMGGELTKNEVEINGGVSSQYLSALMLIAPSLPQGLTIRIVGELTSIPYVEMTLALLQKIGVTARFTKDEIAISPKTTIADNILNVESDWSSLSYFYSLVALSEAPDTLFRFRNFSENNLQGDAALELLYEGLGVKTTFDAADNTVMLQKNDIPLPESVFFDLSGSPDLAQTIAVTCLGLGIGCTLIGLHTLKIKETDRLKALKNELEKLGGSVTITDSSLQLEPCDTLVSDVVIETYDDHRMAMAFAPLGTKVKITIKDRDVVSKSYPEFWEDWQEVGMLCQFLD